ncbi:MAG TPA: YtxH domain-containing protein [Ktedonosporobacter sp.]|nr:YtxH domain-containing protein [Ktedonosporobacter sp.]
MNNFVKGILFGVGIGLLIAPMKGEEMRKQLSERLNGLQEALPERDQVNAYTQQVSSRVAQSADTMKGYARQAASTVKDTANNLNDVAHNAASTVRQTGKDVADTTRENFSTGRDNFSSY